MESLEKFYNWETISIILILSYLILAGSTYVLIYRFGKVNFERFRIQKIKTSGNTIRLEILYSGITLMIYALSCWTVFQLYDVGITRIYFDFNAEGPIYFIISIILMVAVHDTYFYWTHRLIHHPRLFNLVHRIHHLSHSPSPWASYSFHPIEAVISVGYIYLIVLFIPAHPMAILIFLGIMFVFNLMGHLGYEFFSVKFIKGPIGRWINTTSCHDLHHRRSRYNFGLYFTFWDRLMGTFKPE